MLKRPYFTLRGSNILKIIKCQGHEDDQYEINNWNVRELISI